MFKSIVFTDKPTIEIKAKPFYLLGTVGTVKCIAAAYPQPKFYWKYKSCEADCPYQTVSLTTRPVRCGIVKFI